MSHSHTQCIWRFCTAGSGLPNGECFLALGFELQPVELCYPDSVKIQHTPCAQLTFVLLTGLTPTPPNPAPHIYGYTPTLNTLARVTSLLLLLLLLLNTLYCADKLSILYLIFISMIFGVNELHDELLFIYFY